MKGKERNGIRTLLELVRIIFIFFIIGGILGYFLEFVYVEMGIDTENYGWLVFFAIFLLIFVLYRNKLQFSGWYKGVGRKKLPKIVSQILLVSAVFLLILPAILSVLVK
ncbi:hypothetical protein WAX74_10475 [Psychrobacillus sp. FJAT-51614]|uniref:DUF3899 domain-containing protein n=1 Tax=Psychrobacillus mangrovi TaxID=3117745 RepID=A0ABU8F4X9_9BACI